MDDSIIAVIAAILIGVFQLVASANKKKKEKERIMQTWSQEGPDVAPVPVMTSAKKRKGVKKDQIGKTVAEIADITEKEVDESEETTSLLHDFSPQKAILFSEVLNPKWNS